ncbi:5-guanidino-2-oxopentanoate decarboxylase [Ruegeria marina]|uniref:Acetolactate synthase-1/2/3 large subunit n=1 Tax=Ruegeria marina TaxID=639004 RepID=A0A1G6UKF6_9RHOB|nr:5-guanidino-2-oxopentanoate decarboxylase [Ruegeria marina]SDD41759.1 acetolactate synthase-1/2/3 large subunit [Ruegeria marina]
MPTIGEALVSGLATRGVECVFGIPGVHTIELYRGLAASGIRHVTPRHEQGAGFMADGYARVSGKPGVAFVITGPGVTNTLTAMGQARADSVPILTVSGVNARASLGRGQGHLHELPDQLGMVSKVALEARQVVTASQLAPALDAVFARLTTGRKGPCHIEIPLDVAGAKGTSGGQSHVVAPEPDPTLLAEAARRLVAAERPVILAGGGARRAGDPLRLLAERLDAPVVQTTNARGLMHGHPLGVAASPSLTAVRKLIEDADVVLAVGTELGPTDYDMYATGRMARMPGLIRIDVCSDQLSRHPAELGIHGESTRCMASLLAQLTGANRTGDGAARAGRARQDAWAEIGPYMQGMVRMLDAARDAVPDAIMVGDSTQPVYAGNLYYDHDRPGGWFNAATGFGALGYGIPAAVGAAIAAPDAQVICIAGDGGAQFSLAEMMVARDENLSVTFVIWNSNGYREIDMAMRDADIEVVGCDPSPPDFHAIAAAFGMAYASCAEDDPKSLAALLTTATARGGPSIIEVAAPYFPDKPRERK